ncbi:MAG: zinc ribbon domain-containing protein [Candidatus Sumerlaeia bacterium]|nr:zinc ribbon domain-containing protein [Candidatus Sumerlaeia bacterium]
MTNPDKRARSASAHSRPFRRGQMPEALLECPNCGFRFAGGDPANQPCPSCGDKTGQVYLLREQPQLSEPLVEVHRAPDWLQAEMIREYLLAEGLLVAFSTRVPWGLMTFTVDGLAEVGILTLQSDADQARRLIEQFLETLNQPTTDALDLSDKSDAPDESDDSSSENLS